MNSPFNQLTSIEPTEQDGAAPVRKRPRPGERRIQILQVLAQMLESPKGDRVTTAALAARLEVSEAALYRHFASKAQMFEGLIAFIEQTIFGLINQITEREEAGDRQAQEILMVLLGFGEKNPGMTRVLLGDALWLEDERLQDRIAQVFERIESSLKQSIRVAQTQGRLPQSADGNEVSSRAAMMISYVVGRWHRYARSGFKKAPTELNEFPMRALFSV
ncbi:nucleoid occlusion factor SlmA [Polynucleobacter sp. 30F-ANTBAC]|jgi:TetR/AcrR family transcriptional regulator|uniref:nucleoid occlusion factor SlmA n=1 Tax=Polynucleobacter sp. 30F-ANTBAC TaxID=2689095 RepID=UPI001C0C76DE|nr:nucleoid occlusion factor SlmA [Polynucleobacter sp. 30F-ANTBAC]MBU3600073.1 nucleoid occlusion factor SlmA [Polynucleobacter sp. 30F-ANTBAC]